MKKILLLFVATLLLTACSKDTDSIESPANNQKTYPVNFRVKKSSPNVEINPLRSTNDPRNVFVYMIIYDAAGKLVFERNLNEYEFRRDPALMNEDGSMNFMALLPFGNYHYAFIGSTPDPRNPIGLRNVVKVEDFKTDYYSGGYIDYSLGSTLEFVPTYDNFTCFFENGTLTVEDTDEPQTLNVELQPMWSQLKVAINDAQTFAVPEGTDALEFVVSPHYYGYGIENKLATLPYPREEMPNIVSLDSIRTSPSFEFSAYLSKTTPQNNNIAVTINYIKKEGDTNTVLQSRELRIPRTQLENGYYYNVGGNLGSSNNDQTMNISLGSFNPENVVIEF